MKDVNNVRFRGDSTLMGMSIKAVYATEGAFLVQTTGARYEYAPGELQIYQDLNPNQRLLATITFDKMDRFEKVESNNDHALLWSERFNIGIYGDSTCIIASKAKLVMNCEGNFKPFFEGRYESELLLTDNAGGMSISHDPFQTKWNIPAIKLKTPDWKMHLEIEPSQSLRLKLLPEKEVVNYRRQIPTHTYYVSNLGSDRNDGLSKEKPFLTVAKAIRQAKPGDIVYLRDGVYRQSVSLGADSIAQFNTGATSSSRITFKSYPGERAVITSMQLRDKPEYWREEPGYKNVFVTSIALSKLPGVYKPERIPNCSQDGIPLKLMTDAHLNGGPELLKGPGQWVRNTNSRKIFVWSLDGRNPGLSKTEICEFPRGGTATICLYSNRSRLSNKPQPDYITFENLTIEGGYYPLEIETNNIVVRGCTICNSYGDAIKVGGARPKDANAPDDPGDMNYYNSIYGLVENCDIYAFGEQGIDITGGDYWVIRDNKIHNNACNRGDLPGGTKSSGIILKNNCVGTVVERNKVFEIDSLYGAITIGGSSWGNIADEAVKCIVSENEMYSITGPYVVLFMAADTCVFRDNIVRNCILSDTVIRFSCGDAKKENYKNRNCAVLGNQFFNVQSSTGLMVRVLPAGGIVNLKIDYNKLCGNMKYILDEQPLTLEAVRKLGYEKNSI